jgi:predicted site-specific integrase-resolvase
MSTKFHPSREAARILGVHPNSLRKWADNGEINCIRTKSGQRRYDVDSYIGKSTTSTTICYCRVSSHKQRDDLERQVEFLRNQYPTAEFVRDIGSGLNFKRKGLKTILERAMSGTHITLVVAHRDRLARFGIDLIRQFIEQNGGKLVVLDETLLSPEQELTNDLLNIVHVFSARMHRRGNYKKQIHQIVTDNGTEEVVPSLAQCK